ncbi:hypothetical protein SCALM49S_06730 [Streptomyces californicus]
MEALDAGADDYVTKPFGMDDAAGPPAQPRCAGRTPDRCRRTAPRTSPSPRRDGFTVDLAAAVHRDGPRRSASPPPNGRPAARSSSATPAACVSQKQRPPGGVGPVLRHRDQLPAGLRWPSCAASWRPTPSHPRQRRHRARHGLPRSSAAWGRPAGSRSAEAPDGDHSSESAFRATVYRRRGPVPAGMSAVPRSEKAGKAGKAARPSRPLPPPCSTGSPASLEDLESEELRADAQGHRMHPDLASAPTARS